MARSPRPREPREDSGRRREPALLRLRRRVGREARALHQARAARPVGRGRQRQGLLDPATNHCATDDDEDIDVGNVVYVFEGSATPDDVDGTDDPVATVEATRETTGDYTYRTLLAPGTYTVVFTCEAANDFPTEDDEITFADPVGVTNPIVRGPVRSNTTTAET